VTDVRKSKTDGQVQFAALPFQIAEDGRARVMLMTSRETQRWVIPKGWPMRGRKPREVAAREAFEEAGLVGRIVGKKAVGSYHDTKQLPSRDAILCEVFVFLFRVERQLDNCRSGGNGRRAGWSRARRMGWCARVGWRN
jgi:8-oxo-dGTP pyrophosphatase MutT (NUDIX family)